MVNHTLLNYLRNVFQLETDIYICDSVIVEHQKMIDDLLLERQNALKRLKEPKKPKEAKIYVKKPERAKYPILEKIPILGFIGIFSAIGAVILIVWWLMGMSLIFNVGAGILLSIVFLDLLIHIFFRIFTRKKRLLAHEIKCKEIDRQYEEDMKAYEANYLEAERQAQEETQARLEKYQQDIAQYHSEYQKVENDFVIRENELNASLQNYCQRKTELEATIRQMYDANIIHCDYRSIVPVSMFINYIEKERCYRLEGPTGAYNKYEDELRSNIIISKLDRISSSLDGIQSSMGTLYGALVSANTSINRLCSNVKDQSELQAYNSRILADRTAALASIGEANLREIEKINRQLGNN